MKPIRSLLSAAVIALALKSSVLAVSISGAINFNGTPTVDNPGSFATSTRITAFTDLAVGATHTGNYASVPTNQAVTFATPIIYAGAGGNPAGAAIPSSPLWTFTIGATIYSFSASSIVSAYSPSTNTWSMAGTGLASITGFDSTLGNYNLSVTSSGPASFAFAATTAVGPDQNASPSGAAGVPDGGSSAILLGLGLVSVGLLARQVKRVA